MRGSPPETGSWIEVDAAALRSNLTALAKEFAPARLCFVVKADAYGHGAEDIVAEAEAAGIREFAVFSSHEAWHALRRSDGQSVLQVMGHMAPDAYEWAARNGIEPWVKSSSEWAACLEAARGLREPLRVHLELETGMHRTGLGPVDAIRIAQQAQRTPGLQVRGVCTHLAGAEDRRNDERVAAQVALFHKTVAQMPGRPLRHVASSSAALLHPEYRLDMVRTGIAGYGMWPTPEVRQGYHARDPADPVTLRRALSWKTRILAVHQVPKGEHIGYGQTYRAPRTTTVATLPVGYGDGFSRSLSGAGHVLVRGRRCPIIGQINMNMVQVDIGDTQAAPGDEVVLIGDQGDETIGVHSFAESQAIINYELMARLSQDIPRRFLNPARPRKPGARARSRWRLGVLRPSG